MKQHLEWITLSGRLLGANFYYDPTACELASIHQFFRLPDWQVDWQCPITPETQEKIQQGLEKTTLQNEYQALFIGPNELIAPPWASVYLDPESVVFGQSLIQLREFLQQHRIEFVSNTNEPEDHIGLMLMLAAYLAENRPEQLPAFLGLHLLSWSERYLELLSQTDSLFYQGLAELTQQTLADWQKKLKVIVTPLTLYR